MSAYTGRLSARASGAAWEEKAGAYLRENGYEILCRNYRCRQGEIDIIARDGEYLCFIEVKYRKTSGYGSALEAVDFRKQQRISRTALHYLTVHGLGDGEPCRFDVVGVTPERIELVKDAFAFRG